MKKIGSLKFQIAPQFVDFQSKIKLSYLVDLILTVSGYNADEKGFGIRHLNKLGGTWVLSRFSLMMEKMSKEYDKIEIETWVADVKTYNTIRNYRVLDSEGNVIGNATSVWVMINVKSRRPMEMALLKGIDEFIIERDNNDLRTRKLDDVEGEPVAEFRTKYGDIDINQHVNTVRYVDWLVNTFTLDEHKENNIKRFDINFMSEILFDEHIQVYRSKIGKSTFGFEIKANNRTACKGEMLFL